MGGKAQRPLQEGPAAPGRSHDSDELAGIQVQVHAFQHDFPQAMLLL
jgi:hypothetical protein